MKWTLSLALLLAACGGTDTTPTTEPAVEAPPAPEAVTVDRARLAAFGTLPTAMESDSNPITPEKVTLGRMLYYETRLSKNHDVSCNTCHGLDNYGVDSAPTSTGHKAQVGGRNAPTVYNAASHIAQFWDGRSPDIEDQAKGPPLNPIEMAMVDAATIEATLSSMPEYVALFTTAFPGEENPVTFDNMAKAIGAFERGLVTPDAFDAFQKGDDSAMTDAQKRGLNTFLEVGCTTCHSGPYLGGSSYQKLGMVMPWTDESDLGRMDVTKSEADKLMFKVPGLRNIEKTAPYYHNGKVSTLDEAIKLMGTHQLGVELTDDQVKDMVSFMGALTGPLPTQYIAMPELPASTDATPKADPN
ncbi:MAG: c-type cytochrome [Deltaproteobacteria bacterium]|nr:c-type cytochrome [Deltaproteobacteria bacterium]